MARAVPSSSSSYHCMTQESAQRVQRQQSARGDLQQLGIQQAELAGLAGGPHKVHPLRQLLRHAECGGKQWR
jgi:hypothetical protein